MNDDYVPIPPEFWEPFSAHPDEILTTTVSPEGALCSALRDGRFTYADWRRGNFAVRHPDGSEQRYEGVMVNRADLEREFPRPSVQ